ncbi:MAG: ribonuclease III [Verrucomicrobiota bacterium JB023]|nr:ribonuclease III [Verrucomicrobiota bacterium JB023]
MSNEVGKFVLKLSSCAGYEFGDQSLLQMALTHASLLAEINEDVPDNQRLEYLGDAVLQLVLTEELYRRFPEQAEGVLTKWRARLVSKTALSAFAQKLDLGAMMLMGKGEEASGGRSRPSTLADCLEAVFGAVYLDGGLEAAKKVILSLVSDELLKVAACPEEGNPKGELQEVLQAIVPESPIYEIIASTGPDHEKKFDAAVLWQGIELGRGSGSSKKTAEANAAQDAINRRVWATNPVDSQ